MSVSISIPEGAVRSSSMNAMQALREDGQTIMSVLRGEDGNIYAANCYFPSMLNPGHVITLHELSEYLQKGEWYILSDEDFKLESGVFIRIHSEGGIIKYIEEHHLLSEAIKACKEHYGEAGESSFEPETDDCRIFQNIGGKKYEEVYSYESNITE